MTLTLGAALALSACESEETTQQISVERRFAVGMEKFQNEDYLEAIEDFKIVTLQFQGSTLADDAQFYMAESRFLREEYVLAAYEYDVLLRSMPTSGFGPRARFQKAMCYYNLSPESFRDQEYTRKAIDEFQAFLEYNPTDSLASHAEARISELNMKLARKEYENGVIYMKMEYFKSATVSFDFVLEKYHDSPYAEPALLGKAEALFRRRRYLEANVEIKKFFERYPASLLRSEAESLQKDISARTSQISGADQNAIPPKPDSAQTTSKSQR